MFTRFKTLPRYNHARLTKTLINPLISPHRVVFVRFTRRRTLCHAFTHIFDAFREKKIFSEYVSLSILKIAHTTSQVQKPALRFEKKRDNFCRVGRIRPKIAWVTIWSMAHLSRRVSESPDLGKIFRFFKNLSAGDQKFFFVGSKKFFYHSKERKKLV